MLSQLYIENFAVIKELSLELENGFNVFTGETGAGKTMLINAINGILGGRVSRDLIRNGENKASISAQFVNLSEAALKQCEEMGFDCGGEILVSRDITTDGRNICKINGKPATVAMLKDLSQNLITIHGQHDTGHFINSDNDVDFLDSYGDYAEEIENYQRVFHEYKIVKKQLDEINTGVQRREQEIDILKYQINEIESADISVGEEEQLWEERRKIKNSEKIRDSFAEITQVMNENENSLLESIDLVCENLEKVSSYLENYGDIHKRCEDIMYELQDIYGTVRSDFEEFDVSDEDLDYIEERIEFIHKLERKYGGDEEKILEYLKNAEEKLKTLESAEVNIANLQDKLNEITADLKTNAYALTMKRISTSREFVKNVEEELTFLDMPNVKLSLKITPVPYTEKGEDLAELMISTNPGEPMKPISKIASGGEISRVMLAIKNVMADKDSIDTLIFDEVDTGVSGTAAQKIGQKLKEVSRNHQVICITHLAQVASFGRKHFKIYKNVENGKTFTKVDVLDKNQRIAELARIVVGDNITHVALENAEEMLRQSEEK